MSRNIKVGIFSLLLFFLGLSCGRNDDAKKPTGETNESCLAKQMMLLGEECIPRNGDPGKSYQTYLGAYAPFIQSLQKDVIDVCVLTQSDSSSLRDQLESGTKKALAAWMEPLQFVADRLPKLINFHFALITRSVTSTDLPTGELCPKSTDLTIVHLDTLKQVFSENRAFVTYEKIWLGKGQDADIVILHELGHIMGLNDTYIEGGSGCRKGFRDSVMCQAYNWQSLQANDWVGVQRSYCLQTDGVHPNCFNHQKAELLSFLPTRGEVKDYTSYNSYFYCHNKDFDLEFSPFGFYIAPNSALAYSAQEVFGLLSTDRGSLTEAYFDKVFQFTFKIDDRKLKEFKDHRENSVVLTLEDNSLKAHFPYKGEWHDQIFTSCIFDDRAAEYLATRSIDVNNVFTNQTYIRLLKGSKNKLATTDSGTGIFTVGIKAKADTKPDSISVYAGAEPVLLAKKPFDEIARITKMLDDGYLIEVDMSLVPPSTEDLELFVEGQGKVYVHAKLKKHRSEPSL
ncbi:MAG TPA: hypothetical protein VFO10_23405 [Oligoflexus sp.]|uniref:hypothetical protein n=1 Tax=Oligoflexus sp. TaxID=1971216 RepID=UPI002D7E5A5A|nr:hypothetical protein [Oligoflexus sp.]HET9240230.1 hypothetical protein [Oligoflexus sp.]